MKVVGGGGQLISVFLNNVVEPVTQTPRQDSPPPVDIVPPPLSFMSRTQTPHDGERRESGLSEDVNMDVSVCVRFLLDRLTNHVPHCHWNVFLLFFAVSHGHVQTNRYLNVGCGMFYLSEVALGGTIRHPVGLFVYLGPE